MKAIASKWKILWVITLVLAMALPFGLMPKVAHAANVDVEVVLQYDSTRVGSLICWASIDGMPGGRQFFRDGATPSLVDGQTYTAYGWDENKNYYGGAVTYVAAANKPLVINFCNMLVTLKDQNNNPVVAADGTYTIQQGGTVIYSGVNGDHIILPISTTVTAFGWDGKHKYYGGAVTKHVNCDPLVIQFCDMAVQLTDQNNNPVVAADGSYTIQQGGTVIYSGVNGDHIILPISTTVTAFGWDGTHKYYGGAVTKTVNCEPLVINFCNMLVDLDGGDGWVEIQSVGWFQHGANIWMPTGASFTYRATNANKAISTAWMTKPVVDCNPLVIPYCDTKNNTGQTIQINGYGSNVPPNGSVILPKGITIQWRFIGGGWTTKPADCTPIGDTPVNQPPQSVNDAYNTNEDTALVIAPPGVLGNDNDPDGNPITAVWVSDPVHGTLTLNSDGSFTYIPDANYNGSDNFTYKANDGKADSNVATVSITVNMVNDPPVASAGPDQTVEQSSYAGAEVTLNGSGSSDPDGDPLTYEWTWDGSLASGANPTATFPLGSTTVTLTVSDGELSDTDTVEINVVDTTPPEVTATASPPANASGWNNTDVIVTFAATDTGSGVATVDPPVTVTTQGADQVITGTATDNAGNVGSASITLNIDKTLPVVTITAPAAGGFYPAGAVPAGAYTVVEANPYTVVESGWSNAEGEQTYTVTATDAAGNAGSASVTYTVDNMAPVVTITAPAAGAQYTLNQTVLANWTATDALSGIASAVGTVPSGLPIGTGTVGTKTFVVTATDNAGNTTTAIVTYSVGYAFGGILHPINSNGSSIFKLGSTVPVKFQLRDANGNFVTNAVANILVMKWSDGPIGTEIEADSTSAATTGNLFRYSSDGNQYIFNLNTKPLSAGTWRITIKLDDGTLQYVLISLKK